MLSHLRHQLTVIKKVAYSAFLSAFRRSDYGTWGNTRNLDPEWDERSKLLAGLVPAGSSVIEFGAGRLALKKFLPSDCSYTPSDLVDRGEGTVVLDLNANSLPDLGPYDVAIFGGVLEYVFDISRLAEYVSETATIVIFSYSTGDFYSRPVERRLRGWVNNFSGDEVVSIFERAGFVCEQRSYWKHTVICRMSKKSHTDRISL